MRNKLGWSVALPVACSLTLIFVTAGAQEHQGKEPEPVVLSSARTAAVAQSVPQVTDSLTLTVGKSMLLDSPLPMDRVSVGLGGFAEVTAVSPSEVLVNAKAPGETTLIIWQENGTKLYYDLAVQPSRFLANNRLDLAGRQIREELPGQDIRVAQENDTFFLRGRVKDLASADRAFSIASMLGKAVNLLYVDIPAPEAQVLLKVKFASVDRNISSQMGTNLFSTGAVNTIGSLSTGAFSPPSIPSVTTGGRTATASLSDALNLFLFRPDLNLGATIKLVESRGLLEVLAEPNVLAQNGKAASFLAGGEFPFPVVQASGGGAAAAVTIQFREFGVRLNFLPTITPRGTISLRVNPEVSALDFTHGLTVSGFSVPAMTVRKMNTSVELGEGQSFAIGGLLDNRVTETLQKIPFIGDLPVIGKFFQSKTRNKENTELMVIVTPELVRAIPQDAPLPQLKYTVPFMDPNTGASFEQVTSEQIKRSASPKPPDSLPVETLMKSLQAESPAAPEPIQPITFPQAPAAPMASPAAAPTK
jgi:pilus assembly protein CpaC